MPIVEYVARKFPSPAQIARKVTNLGHRENDLGGLDLKFGNERDLLQADLAWHIRAWGQWVLDRARRDLAQYYPAYGDFEPVKKDQVACELQPMRLVPIKNNGTPDIDSLIAALLEKLAAFDQGGVEITPNTEGQWRQSVANQKSRHSLARGCAFDPVSRAPQEPGMPGICLLCGQRPVES